MYAIPTDELKSKVINAANIDCHDRKLLYCPYSEVVSSLVYSGVHIYKIPLEIKLLIIYHIPAFSTLPSFNTLYFPFLIISAFNFIR